MNPTDTIDDGPWLRRPSDSVATPSTQRYGVGQRAGEHEGAGRQSPAAARQVLGQQPDGAQGVSEDRCSGGAVHGLRGLAPLLIQVGVIVG